ncbi:hypothetical protein C8F04DRAFT_1172982 [Mycena alexandri]|uniref:Uncharacterized protein n=1 Tax=Mycena alexandri TaxID=1745969 RepID=A0AAD6XFE1_9AGAR|nr:hypothetical protein C8F04DRAFT_1172982 [Mycena alexandri]
MEEGAVRDAARHREGTRHRAVKGGRKAAGGSTAVARLDGRRSAHRDGRWKVEDSAVRGGWRVPHADDGRRTNPTALHCGRTTPPLLVREVVGRTPHAAHGSFRTSQHKQHAHDSAILSLRATRRTDGLHRRKRRGLAHGHPHLIHALPTTHRRVRHDEYERTDRRTDGAAPSDKSSTRSAANTQRRRERAHLEIPDKRTAGLGEGEGEAPEEPLWRKKIGAGAGGEGERGGREGKGWGVEGRGGGGDAPGRPCGVESRPASAALPTQDTKQNIARVALGRDAMHLPGGVEVDAQVGCRWGTKGVLFTLLSAFRVEVGYWAVYGVHHEGKGGQRDRGYRVDKSVICEVDGVHQGVRVDKIGDTGRVWGTPEH